MEIRPKKHLGQHFLTAPAIAAKIAEAVPALSGEGEGERVLEIGAGRGALSVHLIERFPDMHLVEVDADAVATLKGKLGEGRYTIHNKDVMAFDFSEIGFPLHIVGNLPYNIGAYIIKKTFLNYAPTVLSCTFMVQREVAERIVSGPHSKRNGFLSIFCAFFGTAKILFHCSPGSFFPRPNVESSVFRIIADRCVEQKLERGLWNGFFEFVSAGFSHRRKQLAKTTALRLGFDKEFCENILSNMGLCAAARPEDLDVDDWLEFYRRVSS